MRVFLFLLGISRLFGVPKAVERLSHPSIATPRFRDRGIGLIGLDYKQSGTGEPNAFS